MSTMAEIASVFVLRDGAETPEVLLLRRVHPPRGAWSQVVGKIEPGETAWQAAVRELAEETGLRPDSLWSADCLEQFYLPARDRIVTGVVFVARVGPGAEPRLNAEHDAARWLSLPDAEARVAFPNQRRLLRDIRATFWDTTPHPDLRIDLP
ncbi:NUDIX pyrophosphatase [Jannaschia sp. M317]|uniref:NUDIX hydrolase n=1 Tax=Jannaschia sp. M317 TaxID=2867011 RepID=UPI0021A7C58F|nr:NUDIX domain-containing protein [Jannaschia sp. M317]